MDWVKRNLYFVIGAAAAAVLMGLAGYYLYSGWQHKSDVFETLSKQYATLKDLYNLNPNPGSDKVDNINAAKAQQKQLREFITQSTRFFEPVAPIPAIEGTNPVTSEVFASHLSRTVDQLQRDATSASVTLPPKYNFSFEAQKSLMTFAAGSLNPLAVQLGEVKGLCEAVFAAKVNALDGIRRERVSSDDQKGPPSDYLEEKSVTNDLAILTPYEISFRCFSSELAGVLNHFHSDAHGFLVKTINVEPAPAGAAADPNTPDSAPMGVPAYPMPGYGYTPTPVSPGGEQGYADAMRRRYGAGGPGGMGSFMRRYGGGGRLGEGGGGPSLGGIQYKGSAGAGAQPMMPYQAAPVAPAVGLPGATPGRGGFQTVLNEKPLRVTVLVHLVKLLPKEAGR
jgi:hypothetical protein